MDDSIFKKFYEKVEFVDRKSLNNEEEIDVIIPIINTNELFEKNLFSIYREIPVNRLIIGNGGSTDDSLQILKKFPRVKIIDQTNHKTLGYCISELISLVEKKWFIYLHSDVYLPEQWYDKMKKKCDKYDWFESDSRNTTLIYYDPGQKYAKRPYSGGQMGKKEIFKKIIPKIEDDYLYRNEDFIFKEMITHEGFKYGRVLDTYLYHQIMKKKGEFVPDFKKVVIRRIYDKQWEIDMYLKQLKGFIKYSYPKPYLIPEVNIPLKMLLSHNALNLDEFIKWVKTTNMSWLKYLKFKEKITYIQKIYYKLRKILNPIIKKFV